MDTVIWQTTDDEQCNRVFEFLVGWAAMRGCAGVLYRVKAAYYPSEVPVYRISYKRPVGTKCRAGELNNIRTATEGYVACLKGY